jgi:hypothetical protein
MKRKIAAVGVGLALGVSALAGSATAGGSSNDGPTTSTLATGGVVAPQARIAAFVAAGGSVVRSKGIAGVSHPSVGLYCVDPAGSTFNVNTAVPLASVDWSSSLGDALLVEWRSAGIGCPTQQFSVLTFDGEDGTFDLSNSVSFTFYVP